MENLSSQPVFQTYALSACLVAMMLYFLGAHTARTRGARKVVLNPEDAGINGGANNFQSSTLYDGDGNLSWICNNIKGAENGMSDLRAPINSVIAVFLSDSAPNSGTTPETLDFTSQASRDFTTLQPKLKQPFFIGDGRNSSGEAQRFIPPVGATRLFIATMDAYEWNNNTGGFVVTAHASGKVLLVK